MNALDRDFRFHFESLFAKRYLYCYLFNRFIVLVVLTVCKRLIFSFKAVMTGKELCVLCQKETNENIVWPLDNPIAVRKDES